MKFSAKRTILYQYIIIKSSTTNINKKTYLSLSFFLYKISFHTHDHVQLIDFHFKFSASSFQHVKACVIIFWVSISVSFNLVRNCFLRTPSKYYQKKQIIFQKDEYYDYHFVSRFLKFPLLVISISFCKNYNSGNIA